MDQWSEDSSDEYVRAEQEAALYSVVHYTEVESEANSFNEANNQPNTSYESALNSTLTKAGHNTSTSPITNQSSQLKKSSILGHTSSCFACVPDYLKVLLEEEVSQSSVTQTITKNVMGKNPLELSKFEDTSNQLSDVSGLVNLHTQAKACSFDRLDGSGKLSSVKTNVAVIAPRIQTSVENKKPPLNAIEGKEVCNKQTFLQTNLESNCADITTSSFDINKLNTPKPVGNNLFSPFNTQYLESKTSSKKVFRLDERLFLHEKFIGLETCPDKPKLVQEGNESIRAAYNTNLSANKTEAQKTFVFDLSYHSSGKKEVSSELNSTVTFKPQEPTSAPTINAVDHKSTPPVVPKITKKMKTKKKLKILQSNVLYSSLVNLKSPADKVVVIGLKRPEIKCEVIVLDKEGEIDSVDPDVIILDSDSDESVHVVPVPIAPLPLIISVEDSSDDDRVIRMRPAVIVPFETDPDVAENSFDFLDNVIENCMGDFDGIRKAQANVLSNLISNHSSKESLVDERLFQVDAAVPEQKNSQKINASPFHDNNVSSSTPSASPVFEKDHSVQTVVNVESESDTSKPKTPSHSFKVPKSKVRTKSRQTKNFTKLPEVIDILSSSDNNKIDDDLLVVHSGTKSSTTIEEIISGEINVRQPDQEIVVSEPIISDRKRKREENKSKDISKKKKKPGKKKRAKMERMLQKFIRSQPQANLVTYTKIAGDELVSKEKTPSRSPPTWTKEMKRFYNSSWGGEDHDWKKIRASMSGHPFSWQVINEDRYPGMSGRTRAVRCRQCQRSGHFAWACPDLKTGTKCRVCGQPGHMVKDCPNSICLKCGQPSQEFLKWCWQCKGSQFGDCTMCVWQHSPTQPCKNHRLQPSNVRPHVSANAGYKGYRQRYGNSQPAERGFSPYYNKNFSRRPYR